jgi:hypothetical protein
MKPPEFGQPELSNNESEAIHNIKHVKKAKDDPRCVCGHLLEDAIHFFLECPLYQHDRTSLFNYFNNIVPISIEYILFGCNEISEELAISIVSKLSKIMSN